jgi:WS/DGAT/MGAT family acyltransferase
MLALNWDTRSKRLHRYNYERLSSQDTSFLVVERPNLHMHVGTVQIFELGPLGTKDGGVDYKAIKRFIESVLYRIPRYRERLERIPFENTPVWVDDAHFNIDFHVRHTSLPKPGSEEQLKKLSGRIMAQQLDRTRPLWEIWVVEGLGSGRFALISKIHHCMVDGTSGVDISQVLQSPTPEREICEAPPFIPRAVPTRFELLRDSLARRMGLPFQALSNFRRFQRETENLSAEIGLRARALRDMFIAQSSPAPETPINAPLGPHRIFDWTTTPLSDLKAVRKGLGCSVNDVVLTTVTGAFRDLMLRRQVRPEELDFRVEAPVSVRREDQRGKMTNRVSTWLVPLPLGESAPLKQLEQIHQITQVLKQSQHALGIDMMMSLMEIMPTGLLSLGVQAAVGATNSIVTNVPGPQFPLYLLGAEMLGLFPQVPLLPKLGLGIALISYNGQVCWGFNADPALLPDLEGFVTLVRDSFKQVADAAGVKLSRPEERQPLPSQRDTKQTEALLH